MCQSLPMVEVVERKFRCPDLKTQSDETFIREALESVPGIEDYAPDHNAGTVWVRFADPRNEAFVRDLLSKTGYPVEED